MIWARSTSSAAQTTPVRKRRLIRQLEALGHKATIEPTAA
jgi:hypothetical protein